MDEFKAFKNIKIMKKRQAERHNQKILEGKGMGFSLN